MPPKNKNTTKKDVIEYISQCNQLTFKFVDKERKSGNNYSIISILLDRLNKYLYFYTDPISYDKITVSDLYTNIDNVLEHTNYILIYNENVLRDPDALLYADYNIHPSVTSMIRLKFGNYKRWANMGMDGGYIGEFEKSKFICAGYLPKTIIFEDLESVELKCTKDLNEVTKKLQLMKF